MKMTEEAKNELKALPIVVKRCSVCNSRRSYTNPVWKCEQCEHLFCFDHLIGGQINEETGYNDLAKSVCFTCQKEYAYFSV